MRRRSINSCSFNVSSLSTLGSPVFPLVPVLISQVNIPFSFFEMILQEAGSYPDPTADGAENETGHHSKPPQGSQNEKSKNYLEAGSTVPMIEGWGYSFLGLESSGVF